MRTTFSLEGDPSIFEGRPSEALPVAGEHGSNGNVDEHFGASNLGARHEYWASDSSIGSSMEREHKPFSRPPRVQSTKQGKWIHPGGRGRTIMRRATCYAKTNIAQTLAAWLAVLGVPSS